MSRTSTEASRPTDRETRVHHDTHGKVTAHTVGAEDVGEYVLTLVDELLLRGRILKRGQVVAALDLLLIAVGPEAGRT